MKSVILILTLIFPINLFGQMTELDDHYRQARLLYEKGKYHEAINEFNICYKNSDNPKIAFWLSASWAKLSNPEKCKKYYLIAEENSQKLSEDYKKRLEDINNWLINSTNKNNKKIEFSGDISGSFSYELEADTCNIDE